MPRSAALLLPLLAMTAPPPAPAQAPAAHPRVEEAIHLAGKWLDAERAYRRIPGVSAAVVSDQAVVWSAGFGHADLATQRPATPSTVYSICSISKLFTSIAALQLRDQGRLRLDDPVERHLPWFTIARSDPGSGPVTIEGLLTHASGLPREAAFPYWSGPHFAFPTREAIIRELSSQRTLYPAATWFQYSNLGMTLLGEIVAAAGGRPFDEYVRSGILQPLGLASTWPDMPEAERGRRLATGYGAHQRDGDRPVLPFYLSRGIAPAAGFASTAEDLARFAAWQFRLLRQGGTEVLDANTLREMHRVHWVDPDFSTHWGLGFSVWRTDNTTFVGHGGACPGYRTQLLLEPKQRVAAIAMANAIDVNAGALARGLYEIMGPALKAAADTAAPPKPADPALRAYLGTYESWWGGERELVLWEGGLASVNLPAERPVAAIEKLRRTGEHTFRRVRADGELAEEWRFTMGPDGRAATLVQNYNVSRRLR
jgi:CubicO group peptidase (beta-lactamase class C family)